MCAEKKMLKPLCDDTLGDLLLGQQLAKCYWRLDDISGAIQTLYTCLVRPADAVDGRNDISLLSVEQSGSASTRTMYDFQSVTMLAELLVLSKRFEDCEELLLKVVDLELLEQNFLLSLVVQLGASQLYLNRVE